MVLIFIICLAVGVLGQVLMKYASQRLDLSLKLISLDFVFKNILTNWQLITGVFCYVLSMSIYLYILTSVDISKAAPIMSLSYVLVLLFGALLFHENVNTYRIFGVFVIVIGVFLVTRS